MRHAAEHLRRGGSTVPRAGAPAATIAVLSNAANTAKTAARSTIPRPIASFSSSSRSRIGRAAQTRASPPRSATFVPNSVVCGAMRSVLVTATRKKKTMRLALAAGHRLRIGDHEEEEDQHLGREHDHAPVVEAAHWRERPPRHHGVAGRGENPEARCKREPERRCRGEEPEARSDQEPADQDDCVRQDHPGAERRPPEVERLEARAPEHDEHDDEPDVRRVEDVRSPVADQVLRRQRERGDAREHPPGVEAPVVADGSARHPQDQRDAAAGEHRARGPHERVLTPERDRDLHDRARDDGGEDLRHGHVEPQLRLPEHVDRDDDRGDVQARVAQLRQHHRIGEPLDLERLRRGRHPPMMIERCRFLSVGSSGP